MYLYQVSGANHLALITKYSKPIKQKSVALAPAGYVCIGWHLGALKAMKECWLEAQASCVVKCFMKSSALMSRFMVSAILYETPLICLDHQHPTQMPNI